MCVATEEGIGYCSSDLFLSPPTRTHDFFYPVSDVEMYDDGSDVSAIFSTRGAGIWWSPDYLSTTIVQIGGSQELTDTRAIAQVGNQLYVAAYATGSTTIHLWQNPGWTGKGGVTGTVPTDLALVDAGGGLFHGFLTTSTKGMWFTFDLDKADSTDPWDESCSGVSGSSVNPFSSQAVAVCPDYLSDAEVWEGRSNGFHYSMDAGLNCDSWVHNGNIRDVAIAPGYHVGGTLCHGFIGADSGLYLVDCNAAAPGRTNQAPPVVPITAVAIGGNGITPSWAASPLGLFRNLESKVFQRYNAFYGDIWDIRAIELPLGYTGAPCGGTEAEVFIAEWKRGVWVSADRGSTWNQVGPLSWARLQGVRPRPVSQLPGRPHHPRRHREGARPLGRIGLVRGLPARRAVQRGRQPGSR